MCSFTVVKRISACSGAPFVFQLDLDHEWLAGDDLHGAVGTNAIQKWLLPNWAERMFFLLHGGLAFCSTAALAVFNHKALQCLGPAVRRLAFQ